MASPQSPITPIKQQRVYNQIVEQILDLIERGDFQPGMRLPPERSLARQLEVSRASLREALTVLQMLGRVETILGQGTFVCEPQQNPLLDAPAANMGESPFSILQARKIIEPATASLAAGCRTEASLHRILEILESVEADHSQVQVIGEAFSEGDRKFHMEIARATGNPILIATQQMIHDLMGQQLWVTLMRHTSFSVAGRWEEALAEHRSIYEAIQRSDATLAGVRMKAHLLRVEKIMENAEMNSKMPVA